MNRSPFCVPSTLPGMRLAVQQLLDGAVIDDRSSQVSQCAAEELPVHVAEQRIVAARHQLFSLRDTVGEVRTLDDEGPHAGVQPLERMCEVGR